MRSMFLLGKNLDRDMMHEFIVKALEKGWPRGGNLSISIAIARRLES